jgi:acyl-CoA oxidase
MTAEGDNSVLMQKVSKELLVAVQSGKHSLQNASTKGFSTASNEALLALIRGREARLVRQLGSIMSQHRSPEAVYKAWMFDLSDLVQATARAHGIRIVYEQVLSAAIHAPEGARVILTEIATLYGLHVLEEDLAWFLADGVFTPEEGKRVVEESRAWTKRLAPQALNIVNAFGIPDHVLLAPIAADWVKYNDSDNKGEIRNAKL